MTSEKVNPKLSLNDTAKNIPWKTVCADWDHEGIKIRILRGPGAFCTYLGIPNNHPLANLDYDSVNVNCHGGLTFGQKGFIDKIDGKILLSPSYYWYGYDYAHAGDCIYFLPKCSKYVTQGKDWTLQEVIDDAEEAILSLNELMLKTK